MKTYLLPGLLAVSLAGHAQAVTTGAATPYQTQYDSLQARARRVRLQVAASTVAVRTQWAALFGTRRVIVSLGEPLKSAAAPSGSHIVLMKREVVKHKTHGADVKKVTYYGTGGSRRLYEYYANGQLVQLELSRYPVANGAGGYDFCTMSWVRGDYLTVSQRVRTAAGGAMQQTQVFTNPLVAPN